MFKWKKAAAAVAAAALACTMTGCGKGTAYAVTIDGVQVNAGVYIYYSYAAYNELTTTLKSENSELDIEDDKTVKAQTMDGVGAETWILDKTMEYCQQFVAAEQKFEELKLELSEEDQTEIDSTIDSFWDNYGEVYEKNGISKNSVKKVLENNYKTNEVFLYYYDIDGDKGVTEDEIKEYYIENNARVRYIQFSLKDGNGEDLDDAGKADMKKMVEEYLTRLKGLKSDDEMDAEMDAIQSDYNAYVTSISEEAAAETATSATDENGNEIAATTVTTTTTAETTTTTTAAEEETADGTTVAGDSDGTETTAAQETADETTTEAAGDEESGETTTTTSEFASERVIAKVTTDEDTKEEDITYSPSKAAYDFIFNDAELGVPEFVDDAEEGYYYIIVRRDIEDRMTDDDLWTEDQIKTQISAKYSDEFEDTLDGWTSEQTVEKNDRAIKRYDAFEIDMSSES